MRFAQLALTVSAVLSVGSFQPLGQVAVRIAEPTVIDLAGNGIVISDSATGIAIDINGDGVREQVGWTSRDTDDSFLCLDHNENGIIDVPAEFAGGTSGPPIGFALLAAYDGVRSAGRPEAVRDRRPDGRIDKFDALFHKLILWTDTNRNGRSEEEELQSLEHAGILEIASGYEEVAMSDGHGNTFKYKATARRQGQRGVSVVREVFTVRLAGGS